MKKSLLYFAFILILFSGCQKNVNSIPESEQMVLVYIAANNNLRQEAIRSVIQMQKGKRNKKGELLVFLKTNSVDSHLIKIGYSDKEYIVSDTLKSYSNQNSLDPLFFRQVIIDSRILVPAQRYSLILWSHATSWIPKAKSISTKSFGRDNNQELNIIELKDALPNDFEYIIFDACYMGSLEVVFELKDKAKYIISSPTEIISTGFPYKDITPFLFEGLAGLKKVANIFMDYYKNRGGLASSATISIVDTQHLPELGEMINRIIIDNNFTKITKEGVQKLYFQNGSESIECYDFIDCISKNFAEQDTKEVRQILGKVVIYKDNTDLFFNHSIKIFSGLSLYIPLEMPSTYKDYYSTLDWNRATNWLSLIRS